jgi:5-amino-6-(5-phosphoribosylamino)uracil reductase
MTLMAGSRPYVVASIAQSVNGHIDDSTVDRLVLSNDADLRRVDGERSLADAIMVGANTVRRDNPRLLVRSADLRAGRLRQGRPSSPAKVTVTASGDLSRDRAFFTQGDADVARLVYSPASTAGGLRLRLDGLPGVEVISTGPRAVLPAVLADLADRGVGRLFVEGGTRILTQLLAGRLVDELHYVVAPFFVSGGGPRFVGDDASFPFDKDHRMTLVEMRQIGDVALLRYELPAEEPARVSAA